MTAAHWETPVLESVGPVVAQSTHVRTVPAAIDAVAEWMAPEGFVMPGTAPGGPFPLGDDPATITNFTMLTAVINFAFTDFATNTVYDVQYDGNTYVDAEGMIARLHRAHTQGVPVLTGAWMAEVDEAELGSLLRGNIDIPFLDVRVRILNEVGAALVDRFDGGFHYFVQGCPPALYAGGEGVLERLVQEFPRFDDVSTYRGAPVTIWKLAQLSLWSLHLALQGTGTWALTDLDRMAAFADYILPVALRSLGIMEYTDDLAARVDNWIPIERDSEEEVEIRAHTIHATALLTDAINALRPPDRQIIIPQLDFRLWDTYHTTYKPHHLTATWMY